MDETLTIVIVIGLTAILIFVLPVIEIGNRVDTISQVDTKTTTSEFINTIKTTGKLTIDEYNEFFENLSADGNLYNVELEFKILDENPGKKSLQTTKDKIGENEYYSVFTTQIEEALEEKGVYELKEGDIVVVSVKNATTTFVQQIKDAFYTATSSEVYTIQTTQSGLVVATGSNVEKKP